MLPPVFARNIIGSLPRPRQHAALVSADQFAPAGFAASVTIPAWLTGHVFDLQDLAEFLPSGKVRVIRSGDEFYLTAAELDNPPASRRGSPRSRREGACEGQRPGPRPNA
jgi:hypothetical protein